MLLSSCSLAILHGARLPSLLTSPPSPASAYRLTLAHARTHTRPHARTPAHTHHFHASPPKRFIKAVLGLTQPRTRAPPARTHIDVNPPVCVAEAEHVLTHPPTARPHLTARACAPCTSSQSACAQALGACAFSVHELTSRCTSSLGEHVRTHPDPRGTGNGPSLTLAEGSSQGNLFSCPLVPLNIISSSRPSGVLGAKKENERLQQAQCRASEKGAPAAGQSREHLFLTEWSRGGLFLAARAQGLGPPKDSEIPLAP